MNTKVIEMNKAAHSRPFVAPTQMKANQILDELCVIRSKRLLPTIESIATGTPNNVIRQSDAAKFVANFPTLEQNQFRIEKLYSNSTRRSKRARIWSG